MMVLSHVLIGGVIGKEVDNPYFAFILGVLSHLISDKIPHFWPKSEKWGTFFTWFDIGISLFAMSMLWYLGFRELSFWAGIAGSLSIDCLAMAAEYTGFHKFYLWQKNRQPHLQNKLILSTDATIILLGLTIIVSVR